MIERFSPPSILVNSAHEIVHLSESARRFLQFTGGEPTRNLLRMVHPMLRVELRAALYAAAQTHAAATALRVPVEAADARSLVDIRVTPAGDLAPDFLLVVFDEHPADGVAAVAAPRSADADQAALHLERELVATKAHLRDTIEQSEASTEELKASNEELQAMNEELRSATEELETSREELQSINEELTTDHRVIYANDSLLKMWGRGHDGAIGKTFLELGYEPWHAEMHNREIDQARATRQPVRGEVPFNGTNGTRQYDYIFVPVIGIDGEVEAVAGTTRDVTDRKEGEEQLKASEQRQRFLVTLADAMRPLSDPSAVKATASRLLGEWLSANRVAYFEVRGDEYVVERDYTSGAKSIEGRHPVASFGPDQLAVFRSGCTSVETDVSALASRSPDELEAFAALQIRAVVASSPVSRSRRPMCGLGRRPRSPSSKKRPSGPGPRSSACGQKLRYGRARSGQRSSATAAESGSGAATCRSTYSSGTNW